MSFKRIRNTTPGLQPNVPNLLVINALEDHFETSQVQGTENPWEESLCVKAQGRASEGLARKPETQSGLISCLKFSKVPSYVFLCWATPTRESDERQSMLVNRLTLASHAVLFYT